MDHIDQIGEIGEPVHINFNLAEIFAVKHFCEKKNGYVLYDFGVYKGVYFKICLMGCRFDICCGIAIRILEGEYLEAEAKDERVYI